MAVGSSRSLHELRAILTTDARNFISGLKGAANATRELRESWSKAARDIGSAGQRIGVALAGMSTAVAVTFSKFESTMAAAGAVTRTLGTQDFERLKQAAKDMGEATMFSASQAAGAIEQMGLAGLSTNEIIEALPGALQLAAAAGIEIAQAADVAAKTMRAFGADASELSHINDVLVATFTRSNTDIGQLAEAMKHVAPVSKAMGVSLEQTSAVIAKMGDAGFQGSMAGTALRNIISRLAGAVPEATSKLREFGIETTDSSGKMRDLFDILQDIEQSGMTEADILQVFGARGGPQLLAVLEAGTESLREFATQLENSTGVAADIANAKMNTLAGAWDELTSKVEGFLISAGEKVAPTLRELAKDLQEFLERAEPDIVDALTEATLMLANGLKSLVQWVGENLDGLMALARAFGSVLAMVGNLLTAFPQLAALLIAFKASSILGLHQAVISLGTAIFKTVEHMMGLSKAATEGGGALSNLSKMWQSGAFRVGVYALAIAGVTTALYKAFDAMGVFGDRARSTNDQLRENARILAAQNRGLTQHQNAAIDSARDSSDPQAALRDVVAQAEQRQSQAFERMQAAQRAVQDELLNRSIGTQFENLVFSGLDAIGLADEQSQSDAAFKQGLEAAKKQLEEAQALTEDAMKAFADSVKGTFDKALQDAADDLSDPGLDKFRDLVAERFEALSAAFEDGTLPLDQFKAAVDELDIARIALDNPALNDFRDGLHELSAEFAAGTVSLDQFKAATDSLKEGLDAVGMGDPRMDEFRKRMADLSAEFAGGGMSLERFEQRVNALKAELNAASDAARKAKELGAGGTIRDLDKDFNLILTDDLKAARKAYLDTLQRDFAVQDKDLQGRADFLIRKALDDFKQTGDQAALAQALRDMTDTIRLTAANVRFEDLQKTLDKQAFEERVSGLDEFERVRKLIGDGGTIDERMLKAIGESVEGATPEAIEELVSDFMDLQGAGKLTEDAINNLVAEFLEAVEKLTEGAEKAKELREELDAEIQRARDAALEREAPGAVAIRDLLETARKGGASRDEVFDLLRSQGGVSDELAGRIADQFAKAVKEAAGQAFDTTELAKEFAGEQTFAQAQEAARREQMEREAPGFGRARDLFDTADRADATEEEVRDLLALQAGVTKEMAAHFAELFAAAAGDPAKLDAAALGFAKAQHAALNAAGGTNTLAGSMKGLGNAARSTAQRMQQMAQQFQQQMFNRMFGGPFGTGFVGRIPFLPQGVTNIGSSADFFGVNEMAGTVADAGREFKEEVLSGADRVQALYEQLVGVSNPFDVVGGFSSSADPALTGGGQVVNVTVHTKEMHPDQIPRLVDQVKSEFRRLHG